MTTISFLSVAHCVYLFFVHICIPLTKHFTNYKAKVWTHIHEFSGRSYKLLQDIQEPVNLISQRSDSGADSLLQDGDVISAYQPQVRMHIAFTGFKKRQSNAPCLMITRCSCSHEIRCLIMTSCTFVPVQWWHTNINTRAVLVKYFYF